MVMTIVCRVDSGSGVLRLPWLSGYYYRFRNASERAVGGVDEKWWQTTFPMIAVSKGGIGSL